MFTEKSYRKSLSLLLSAALLIACLAGCNRTEVPPASGGSEPTETQGEPEPDPREVLSPAFQGAMDDVRARYDASRLPALMELFESQTLTVDFTSPAAEESPSLSGTLTSDLEAGMADLALSSPELALEALAHYDSEFIGISSEAIFGDQRYYGLRPYGLREQLEGSALASMLKIDMEELSRLDEAIGALPAYERAPSGPILDPFTACSLELIRELDWSVEKDSYSATLSPAQLAGFLRKLLDSSPALRALCASLGGTESPDDAIAAIESGGADTTLTLTVSGGRVRHISAKYNKPDGTIYLEVELYGESGELLLVTLEPYFNLELTLGDGEHLSMHITDGETVKLDWAANGALDFIAYANDITDLALDGMLTLADGALSYDGVWTSGNAGVQNPLTLRCVSGGEVRVPEDTVPLTSLTERDIFRIITRTVIGML